MPPEPPPTPLQPTALQPDSSSRVGPPLQTASGLIIESNQLPDNSKRPSAPRVRCKLQDAAGTFTCSNNALKSCTHGFCTTHCPIFLGGVRCSYHFKGTTTPAPVDAELQEQPTRGGITFSRNLSLSIQSVVQAADLYAQENREYRQKQSEYEAEELKPVVVFVWLKVRTAFSRSSISLIVSSKAAQGPKKFRLGCPTWPYFHPQDIPSLTTYARGRSYSRFDVSAQVWEETDQAVRVDRLPTKIDDVPVIYIHALDVPEYPPLPGLPQSPVVDYILPCTPQKRRYEAPDPFHTDRRSPSKLSRTSSTSSIQSAYSAHLDYTPSRPGPRWTPSGSLAGSTPVFSEMCVIILYTFAIAFLESLRFLNDLSPFSPTTPSSTSSTPFRPSSASSNDPQTSRFPSSDNLSTLDSGSSAVTPTRQTHAHLIPRDETLSNEAFMYVSLLPLLEPLPYPALLTH